MITETLHTLELDAEGVVEAGATFTASFRFDNRSPRKSGALRVRWEMDGPVRLVEARRGGEPIGKTGAVGVLGAGETLEVVATFEVASGAPNGAGVAIQAVLVSGKRNVGSNVERRYVASDAELELRGLELKACGDDGVEVEAEIGNVGRDVARNVLVRVRLDAALLIPATPDAINAATGTTNAWMYGPELELMLGDIAGGAAASRTLRLALDGPCMAGSVSIVSASTWASNAQSAAANARLQTLVHEVSAVPVGLPDLREAQLKVERGRSGDVVGVELMIPNKGSGPARGVDVRFESPAEVQLVPGSLRVEGGSGQAIEGGVRIDQIAPGDVAIVRASALLAASRSCDVYVSASMDVAGAHTLAQCTVPIEAICVLRGPTFAALPTSVVAGDIAVIVVGLRNDGSAAAEDTAISLHCSAGELECDRVDVGSIAPGATATAAFRWSAPATVNAEARVEFVATAVGAVCAECQATPASAAITVRGSARLAIDVAAPSALAVGVDAIVRVSVRNVGTAPARHVVIACAAPDGVALGAIAEVDSLAPGAEEWRDLAVRVDVASPALVLAFEAIAQNAWGAECSLPLAVDASPAVEAAISAELDGERVDVVLALKNVGTAPARRVIVRLQPESTCTPVAASLRRDGVGVRDSYAFTLGIVVEVLHPGESTTLTWSQQIDPATAGGTAIAPAVAVECGGQTQRVSAASMRYVAVDALDLVLEQSERQRVDGKAAALLGAMASQIPAGWDAGATPPTLHPFIARAIDEIQPRAIEVEAPIELPPSEDVVAADESSIDDIEIAAALSSPEANVDEVGVVSDGGGQLGEGESQLDVPQPAPALAAAEETWLATLGHEFNTVAGVVHLTGARLQQLGRLLRLGRSDRYLSHICMIRGFLPDEFLGSVTAQLDGVKRQLDGVLLRMQLGDAEIDTIETSETRAELLMFLETARDVEGQHDVVGAGVLKSSVSRREIAEDLEVLRSAPLGSAFAFRALARWIPTSVDDIELAAALQLYRSTLLEALDEMTRRPDWARAEAPPELTAQLERVRDAVDGAYAEPRD